MIQYKKINNAIKEVEKISIEKRTYFKENNFLTVLKELIKQSNKKANNKNKDVKSIDNKELIIKNISLHSLGTDFNSEKVKKELTAMKVLYSNNDSLIYTDYHTFFIIHNINVLIDRIMNDFYNNL